MYQGTQQQAGGGGTMARGVDMVKGAVMGKDRAAYEPTSAERFVEDSIARTPDQLSPEVNGLVAAARRFFQARTREEIR